jgi:hypothetical protein
MRNNDPYAAGWQLGSDLQRVQQRITALTKSEIVRQTIESHDLDLTAEQVLGLVKRFVDPRPSVAASIVEKYFGSSENVPRSEVFAFFNAASVTVRGS